MDELSLHEVIQNAVAEFLAANGGGFPMNFVFAMDYSNSEGESMMTVAAPPAQPVWRSMGLSTYLDHYFRDDAMLLWREAYAEGGGDDG